MDRALVTGGSGFLGSYMCRHLLGLGVDVTSTDRLGDATTPGGRPRGHRHLAFDITDRTAVFDAVRTVDPDVIFHFAGQAYIDASWKDPDRTFQVNVLGTLHLLEAVRARPGKCVLAFAGSGTEYGRPTVTPTPEEAPLAPGTPYASSKAAADLLCYQYFLGAGLTVFRYRIFGTTGPGKLGDACNDFASQIAAAERDGAPREVHVGNLDPQRDISDVRDAIRAMVLVVEKGRPGGAYNIGSGRPRRVSDILQELVGLAKVPLVTVREERRVRPVDEPVHLADVSKIRALGFEPQIEFRQTLREILEHWRSAGRVPVPSGSAGGPPTRA